jgi:hypothetical protein
MAFIPHRYRSPKFQPQLSASEVSYVEWFESLACRGAAQRWRGM